ncbi:hypothetical protein [Nocardia thailandica]
MSEQVPGVSEMLRSEEINHRLTHCAPEEFRARLGLTVDDVRARLADPERTPEWSAGEVMVLARLLRVEPSRLLDLSVD